MACLKYYIDCLDVKEDLALKCVLNDALSLLSDFCSWRHKIPAHKIYCIHLEAQRNRNAI